MFRVVKLRAYPTPEQERLLDAHRHNVRAIKNLSLEHRQTVYRLAGVTVRSRDQDADLRWLQREVPWLSVTPQQVLQQAIQNVDRSYQRFFDGRARFPRFESRGQTGSFVAPQKATFVKVNRKWGTVTLPGGRPAGLGRLRVRSHRALPGTPTGRVTYTREADGSWWVCIDCKQRDRQPTRHRKPNTPVGVDLGVAVHVATSDGTLESFRALTPGEAERLLRLERQTARQKRGSRNQARTYSKIAAIKGRARRRRKDFAEQISHRLASQHDLVVFENLNISGMTKSARGTVDQPGRNVRQKSGLNREILNVGWGQIIDRTTTKAKNHGCVVVQINPAYTSQTCPECGHVDPEARTTRATYICTNPACDYVGHADVGAARNILTRGQHLVLTSGDPNRETVGGAGGTPVPAHPAHTTGTDQHQVGSADTGTASVEEVGTKIVEHRTRTNAA